MNASTLLLCTHEQSCVCDVSTCTHMYTDTCGSRARAGQTGGGDNDAVFKRCYSEAHVTPLTWLRPLYTFPPATLLLSPIDEHDQ